MKSQDCFIYYHPHRELCDLFPLNCINCSSHLLSHYTQKSCQFLFKHYSYKVEVCFLSKLVQNYDYFSPPFQTNLFILFSISANAYYHEYSTLWKTLHLLCQPTQISKTWLQILHSKSCLPFEPGQSMKHVVDFVP